MPADAGAWNGMGLALDVVVKLGLVLALIYASLYLLRRWQGGALASARRQLAVLETARLSPRQSLHLVRVSTNSLTRVWLIGATDQAVTLLSEVSHSQPASPETKLSVSEEAGQTPGLLAASVPGVAGSAAASFLDVLRARLIGSARSSERP
ncbi:MAG: FliO/MopB family protein [Chloroflexi bacterium]|nr:FliO/MopB family protein [Chloroflexota bacterium]